MGQGLVWPNWDVQVWNVAPKTFFLLPYPLSLKYGDQMLKNIEGTPSDLPVREVEFSACLWCPRVQFQAHTDPGLAGCLPQGTMGGGILCHSQKHPASAWNYHCSLAAVSVARRALCTPLRASWVLSVMFLLLCSFWTFDDPSMSFIW